MSEILITSLLCLGSAFYLYLSSRYPFLIGSYPSVGFMPVLEGIATFLLSLTMLVRRLRAHLALAEDKANWRKFSFILVGFLFYVAVLNLLGYFFTSFLFLFYLLKVTDTAGWKLPFCIAFVSSTAFYLFFQKLLGLTMP